MRPFGRGLALDTMFFADEIRDQAEAAGEPGKVTVAPRELTMARQLIEAMTAPFDLKKFEDTYRDRVKDAPGQEGARRGDCAARGGRRAGQQGRRSHGRAQGQPGSRSHQGQRRGTSSPGRAEGRDARARSRAPPDVVRSLHGMAVSGVGGLPAHRLRTGACPAE